MSDSYEISVAQSSPPPSDLEKSRTGFGMKPLSVHHSADEHPCLDQYGTTVPPAPSDSTVIKESHFELIQFLDLQSQVTSLCFDVEHGHLFASLSDGKVEYFAVRISTSSLSEDYGSGADDDENCVPLSLDSATATQDSPSGDLFHRRPPLSNDASLHFGLSNKVLNATWCSQSHFSTESVPKTEEFTGSCLDVPSHQTINPKITVHRQSSHALGYLLPQHVDELTCLSYDHQRHLLYSGSFDSSLKVYDFRSAVGYSGTPLKLHIEFQSIVEAFALWCSSMILLLILLIH